MFDLGLEHKFCIADAALQVTDGHIVQGYASLFGECDRGGDVVEKGAFARALQRFAGDARQIKMLWQHDPTQPIGVWDEVCEDARGLQVRGRLLPDVTRAREAAALIEAGALDGLSIGYRTVRATKNDKGQRLLTELELWEVSLVTFPMLPSARVGRKGDAHDRDTDLRDLAGVFRHARATLAQL